MQLTLSCSFVKNKTDVHPQQADNVFWQDIVDTLLDHSEKFSEKDGPGIIGATFKRGKRNNNNVESIFLFIGDFEGKLSPNDLRGLFDGVQGAIYNTWSNGVPEKCGEDEYRFRAIFPLTHPISPLEYQALFQWVQERTENSLDQSTRDPSRLQYTPRKKNPQSLREPFLEEWEGLPLDPHNLPDGQDIKDIIIDILKSQAELERHRATLNNGSQGGRPGDDFNTRGDVLPYLIGAGAKVVKWVGTDCYLERPNGNGGGHNAILHYNSDYPIFVNFSNKWLELWEPQNGRSVSVFDNFGVFSRIVCGGNTAQAASMLREQGYGSVETNSNGPLTNENKIVANFDIVPVRILIIEGESHEKLECEIKTESGAEFQQLFDKNMFSDVKTFNNSMGAADCVFMGKTTDLRRLQVWLTRPEVMRVHGIKYQGRWDSPEGDAIWVTSNVAFSKDGVVDDPPVVVVSDLADKFVHLSYPTLDPDQELLELFAENILSTNFRQVILPILGWHMACPYKPVFHRHQYRFPILNIWGTAGAGKTSQIQLFQRLLGYEEPQGLDCYGKQFVQLNRWGATNAIPILFTEYRRAIPETAHTAFVRDLMMGFDGSVDARGRPDLSVVLFEKLAPVVVDGNDPLHEPALQERIIQVHMARKTLGDPRSDQVRSYNRIMEIDQLQAFAAPYIIWTLANDPPIADAKEIVFRDPGSLMLAERVRKNLIVIVCGMLSIKNYMLTNGIDFLPIEEIQAYVKYYVQEMASTRRLNVDDFVEDLLYLYQKGDIPFLHVRKDTGLGTILWFHLKSTYPEWAMLCKRTGRSPISVDALEMQFQERIGEYMIRKENTRTGSFHDMDLWGVVLPKARKAGLDIPGGIE